MLRGCMHSRGRCLSAASRIGMPACQGLFARGIFLRVSCGLSMPAFHVALLQLMCVPAKPNCLPLTLMRDTPPSFTITSHRLGEVAITIRNLEPCAFTQVSLGVGGFTTTIGKSRYL